MIYLTLLKYFDNIYDTIIHNISGILKEIIYHSLKTLLAIIAVLQLDVRYIISEEHNRTH